MSREEILKALGSIMDSCDDPDLWEELLFVKHNQEDYTDKELIKKIWELTLEYISKLKE